MTATAASTDVVRTLVRSVLAAETAGVTAPAVALDVPARDLIAAVRRHRVAGLLLAAPSVGLPDEVAAALREDAERSALGALLLAHELVRVLGLLEVRGVRALSFKGVALAVTTTGDLAARGGGDIDLLVSPGDLPEALATLRDAGYVPRHGFPCEPGSWGWRWLTSISYELPLESPRASIDLHWHLTPGHTVAPDFEALWASRAEVRIGGRCVPTLSPAHALWHSCSHAAKDDWRWLRSLVDVHRLARSPEAWSGLAFSGRDVRMTLAVVAAQLGLPPGVPGAFRERRRTALRTARRSQQRPQVDRDSARPGAHTLAGLRTMLRCATGPADVGRGLRSLLLPPGQLADLDGDVPSLRAAARLRTRHVVVRVRGRRPDDG